jgi:hypothetical protein
MTKLSPAAQSVLDAAINVVESPDAEAIAAAVLRAIADQNEFADVAVGKTVSVVRVDYILTIANELEVK